MTCLALTHWASTLNSHLRKPTWLLLVKDYRTGLFASPVSVLFSSLPHPCFPSSLACSAGPRKNGRARDTLLLPSRVSLSRARSFLRLLRRLLPSGGVTPLYKPYRYLITWNFRDMFISRFWWAPISWHLNFANLRKFYILDHFNFAFLSTTIYISYAMLFNMSLN